MEGEMNRRTLKREPSFDFVNIPSGVNKEERVTGQRDVTDSGLQSLRTKIIQKDKQHSRSFRLSLGKYSTTGRCLQEKLGFR